MNMPKAGKTNNVFYRDLEKKYPIIERAEGVYLYDDAGNRYLDFGSGIGVVNIGYNVPEINEAMAAQAGKTSFVYSAPFTTEAQIRISKKIIDMSPEGMSKVLLVSGGSVAMESAIKLARQYHIERGNASKYKIIARWTGYHGNTIGALSASGRSSWREYFEPYLLNFPHIHPPYCYRCPFDKEYPGCGLTCAQELERVIRFEGPQNISAFIAEPIIGTSAPGVTPPPEYYPMVREICDKYDILFISDEVITGFGRTGKTFGIDHYDALPDMMVAGKGVGGGYTPLAVVIVSDKVFEAFEKGSGKHTQGFTYSGNPLSAAVGLALLEYIEKNGLIERVSEMAAHLKKGLESLRDTGIVGDVRGLGFLQGVEFVQDMERKTPFPKEANLTARIVEAAFNRKLMIIGGMPGVVDNELGDQLQITPSFTISEEQIDTAVDIIRQSIAEVKKELKIT
jgi:adenosylmethionine-8-amino-7-oxononanoate aminotransferase